MIAVLGTLGNLALSAFVGALSSWLVAAYYFRKETRAEKIADQIKRGLQQALLPTIYPQFFDEERSLMLLPNQPPPEDKDVPHVEFARMSDRNPQPGKHLEFLIKLRDTGFDLPNPSGVGIRDHNGNAVGVVGLGLGYCRCRVHIDREDTIGAQEITVELCDLGLHTKSGPHRNVQTLPFVLQRSMINDQST